MKTCECGCGERLAEGLYKGRERRFVQGHNPRRPVVDRLLDRLDRSGECWLWTGPTSNGYGFIGDGQRRTAKVHRVAYEAWVGPIPEGLHIDHLCRVRNCCNPNHLEAVTQAENNRRVGEVKKLRTHCRRDHEYTPENTYYNSAGNRGCKTCQRLVARGSIAAWDVA